MGRAERGQAGRLTDMQCRSAVPRDKPYKLSDGRGLFLRVDVTGGKSWRLDYSYQSKRKTIVLGLFAHAQTSAARTETVGLRDARAAADRARGLLADGIDPVIEKARAAEQVAQELEQRKQARLEGQATKRAEQQAKAAQRAASAMTVEVVAENWFNAHKAGWTPAHRDQVWQSLRDHVFSELGRRPINEVRADDILDLLGQMLDAGVIETASRVRQRLTNIWQYAVLRELATVDVVTPTALEFKRRRRNALRVKPKRNFPCVPVVGLPPLLRAMRASTSSPVVTSALWLLCLTAVRTGELRLAKWTEFDLDIDAPVWTVPVERMKIRLVGEHKAADHVVPLSSQAVSLLRDLYRLTGDNPHGWVFPQDRKPAKPISENAILASLAGMGYNKLMTGHGFRTLFATITRELGFRDEVVERQLAHVVGGAVQRAYDRATLIGDRTSMMQSYANHLDKLLVGEPAKVVPIQAGARSAAS